VGVEEFAQEGRRHQRRVAAEHHHRGRVDRLLGHHHRVAGAELLVLDRGGGIEAGDGLGDQFALVADHHHQVDDPGFAGRGADVGDQGSSADLVEDLGAVRTHPGTFAGGEDHRAGAVGHGSRGYGLEAVGYRALVGGLLGRRGPAAGRGFVAAGPLGPRGPLSVTNVVQRFQESESPHRLSGSNRNTAAQGDGL